jgi:hypothetical protein
LTSFETLLGGVTGAGPSETVAINAFEKARRQASLLSDLLKSADVGRFSRPTNVSTSKQVELGCNDKFGVRAKVLRVATHISYTRKAPHGAKNSDNSP